MSAPVRVELVESSGFESLANLSSNPVKSATLEVSCRGLCVLGTSRYFCAATSRCTCFLGSTPWSAGACLMCGSQLPWLKLSCARRRADDYASLFASTAGSGTRWALMKSRPGIFRLTSPWICTSWRQENRSANNQSVLLRDKKPGAWQDDLFQAYCRAEGIGKQCRRAAASIMCALRSIENRNISTLLHGY